MIEKMILDSSETFIQDNYCGRIREVRITGDPIYTGSLCEVLDYARVNFGYSPFGLSIVNIVNGSPSENIPVESMELRKFGMPPKSALVMDCIKGPFKKQSGWFSLFDDSRFTYLP